MSLPFALSIHHFISSVGADAGFAAIIGLAILILLYFAQARETASLRSHAYEATDRIQQIETRLVQALRAQPAAAQAPAGAQPQARQPLGMPAGVPVARRGAGNGAHAPLVPAGVGGPALMAATRMIPVGVPVQVPAAVPVGSPATATQNEPDDGSEQPAQVPTAAVPATAPAGVVAVAAAPAPAELELEQDEGGAGWDGPAPATIAGGANGSSRVGAPPGPPAGPDRQQAPRTMTPRPAGASAARIAPASRAAAPRANAPRRPRTFRSRVLPVILAAVGVIAVLVVLLIATGIGSGSNKPGQQARTTNTPTSGHRTRAAAVSPGSVTVAVLNGTATNQLAARISQNLQGLGYKKGTVTNASDQTHTTTIVAYLPGFRRDALAVAASLKLSSGSVQPVDQPTQQVACPSSSACSANVVVTLGEDLANAP